MDFKYLKNSHTIITKLNKTNMALFCAFFCLIRSRANLSASNRRLSVLVQAGFHSPFSYLSFSMRHSSISATLSIGEISRVKNKQKELPKLK